MAIDEEILEDFQQESAEILAECIDILEQIEDDATQVKRLEDVGVRIDRIMGAAQGLAMFCDEKHPIHLISACSKLGKAISYKGSQIQSNEQFYNVCVALLIDASELLASSIAKLNGSATGDSTLSQTFIDRMSWADNQFAEGTRATTAD